MLWGAGLAAGALLAGFTLSQALAARFRTEWVEAKRTDGRIVVRLFAEAVAAPRDFGDHEGIAAKLEGLRATPQVEYAGVWRGTRPLRWPRWAGRPTPFAPAQLDVRLTATGRVPAVPGACHIG